MTSKTWGSLIANRLSTGCGNPGRDHARHGRVRRGSRGVASLLPLLLSLFVLGTVAVAPLLRGPAPAPGTATSSPRPASVVPARHRGDERETRAPLSARPALAAPAAVHPAAGDSPADVPPGTAVLPRSVAGAAGTAAGTTRAGTLVAGLPARRGPPGAQVVAPLPDSLVHVHPRPA